MCSGPSSLVFSDYCLHSRGKSRRRKTLAEVLSITAVLFSLVTDGWVGLRSLGIYTAPELLKPCTACMRRLRTCRPTCWQSWPGELISGELRNDCGCYHWSSEYCGDWSGAGWGREGPSKSTFGRKYREHSEFD